MHMNSRKYFSVGMWPSVSYFLVIFFRTLIKSGSVSPQTTVGRMRTRSSPLTQAMIEEDILSQNPPGHIQSVQTRLWIYSASKSTLHWGLWEIGMYSMYSERDSGDKQKKRRKQKATATIEPISRCRLRVHSTYSSGDCGNDIGEKGWRLLKTRRHGVGPTYH